MEGIVDADGDARVLMERGGQRDTEEVAVELGGEWERRENVEERGDGERFDGAPQFIGEDTLDGAVVGDSGVAKFHGLHGNLGSVSFNGGFADAW